MEAGTMVDLNSAFMSSVEQAVADSVGRNKPLIVYITNEEAQDEWLQNLLSETTLQSIKDKSVALRLMKGSRECQLFEQIFPNVIVPSVFCVRVSSVLDVIHGDITSEELSTRIAEVLNTTPAAAAISAAPASPSTPISAPTRSDVPQTQGQLTSYPQHTTIPTTAPSQTPNAPRVHETASPDTKSASDSPAPSSSSKRDYKSLKEQAAELNAKRYKEEQIRKAQQAREEKDRIRRLLKADEEERRIEREQALRERERRLSNEHENFDDEHRIDEIIHEHETTLKENIRKRQPSSSGDVCSLSIRLLSGRSLTHTFKVTDTLNDVRQWIDENRTDGDDPYCFHRTIPRVTFGVTDEEKTLESLELVPRSALILKPFASYTNAYGGKGTSSNESTSFFSRILDGFTSLWSGTANDGIDSSSSSVSASSTANYNSREGPFEARATSTQSSQYGSPAQSPSFNNDGPLNLAHPSALNLNLSNDPPRSLTPNQLSSAHISRSGSPAIFPPLPRTDSNIRTLSDSAPVDDRTTYNGNTINLEDDKKSKSG